MSVQYPASYYWPASANTQSASTVTAATQLPTASDTVSMKPQLTDWRKDTDKNMQPITRHELAELEKRWYPKRLSNTFGQPETQIADPMRFAVLAALVALPTFVGILPAGVLAYIWQNQRNVDAREGLQRQGRLPEMHQATLLR